MSVCETWCLLLMAVPAAAGETSARPAAWSGRVQTVLDVARPLVHPRGNRLPLFLWPAMDPGDLNEAAAESLVRQLDQRGIGLIASWSPGQRDRSLARALTIALAQKKLGVPVNVHASACLNRFFNGDPRTAHVDERGQPFWDTSFDSGKSRHNMGCPFALEIRKDPLREQVEFFAQAYCQQGLGVDFAFVDWEIDGPIEFNRAHESSKKCTRCRQHLQDLNNFLEFQQALREIRAELQRLVLAEPIRRRFPRALVGNYAVYPHSGYRYWYDYFEYFVDGQPHIADQRAKYRLWYNEFPLTGYTCAMPVVYTWYPTFQWYDFSEADYRWFYNLLLEASSAGQHTPSNVPIISFVHWHTTSPPAKPDPEVKQLSRERYQELLWHMLLRGTDTFFLWCPADEDASEVELLHAVYAAAQEYGEFLEHGEPIEFRVSRVPGPIVSGLLLGDRLLVRRTDFAGTKAPVEIEVRGRKLSIEARPGQCQVVSTANSREANHADRSFVPDPRR